MHTSGSATLANLRTPPMKLRTSCLIADQRLSRYDSSRQLTHWCAIKKPDLLRRYLFLQGLAKIGGANYWNFATSPLVWSPELKLAPRFNLNELGEIYSEI